MPMAFTRPCCLSNIKILRYTRRDRRTYREYKYQVILMNYRTPLEEAVMKSGYLKGEIANTIQIRAGTLSKLIAGETEPEIKTALKLARFLDKSVEELWGYLVTAGERK